MAVDGTKARERAERAIFFKAQGVEEIGDDVLDSDEDDEVRNLEQND
jgi:hypothetical protein